MEWVFDVAVAKDGMIFIAGDQNGPALYASSDHGKHWDLLQKFSGKGSAEAIAIDKNDPQRVAISTVQWGAQSGGKIYLSMDAGKNWQDISGDLPEGTGAAAMAFSNDGKFLYQVKYAGSVYKIGL